VNSTIGFESAILVITAVTSVDMFGFCFFLFY
jgi:hypothetical protein